VDLRGNVQAASQLQRAIAGRGWTSELFVLGLVKQPKKRKPDLLVNCICDPTFHGRSLIHAQQLVARYGMAVLNHPWAVGRASRDGASHTLGCQADVTMPLTTNFDPRSASFAEHLERHRHTLPVIVRPAGAHGGKGLEKVDSAGALPEALAGLPDVLVTDFADYVSGDGLYRKSRMIYINDRLYRRHVIANDHWNIAGESRYVMAAQPELIEKEKEFIAGTGGAFEDILRHQFRALHLDFGVVDFNLSDDESHITIFEINPCFQLTASIPPEYREMWGYLEQNNARIVDGFMDAMEDRVNNPR